MSCFQVLERDISNGPETNSHGELAKQAISPVGIVQDTGELRAKRDLCGRGSDTGSDPITLASRDKRHTDGSFTIYVGLLSG